MSALMPKRGTGSLKIQASAGGLSHIQFDDYTDNGCMSSKMDISDMESAEVAKQNEMQIVESALHQ